MSEQKDEKSKKSNLAKNFNYCITVMNDKGTCGTFYTNELPTLEYDDDHPNDSAILVITIDKKRTIYYNYSHVSSWAINDLREESTHGKAN